jgi:hypothetical protein
VRTFIPSATWARAVVTSVTADVKPGREALRFFARAGEVPKAQPAYDLPWPRIKSSRGKVKWRARRTAAPDEL